MAHLIATLLVLSPPAARGHLVIAGGGKLPPEIRVRALALAGGPTARIVIVPNASKLADTGPNNARIWNEMGAARVTVLDVSKPTSSLEHLKQADLIWFTGGDQNRLMNVLNGTPVPAMVKQRFEEGAVIGGTSAGAAAMARLMFTGQATLEQLVSNTTETSAGLALMPDVLIDQHFLARRRFNRLFSAVLDHRLIGIGIDEGTAIIVYGREFEVLGTSSVTVLDPSQARHLPNIPGQPAAAANVLLHSLTPGMRFDLQAGTVVERPVATPSE
jgi:cyanophycinase